MVLTIIAVSALTDVLPNSAKKGECDNSIKFLPCIQELCS